MWFSSWYAAHQVVANRAGVAVGLFTGKVSLNPAADSTLMGFVVAGLAFEALVCGATLFYCAWRTLHRLLTAHVGSHAAAGGR